MGANRGRTFPDWPVPATADVWYLHADGHLHQRPLETDLTVIGRITASIWATTDAVDTDFVVRLCDVTPDGRSLNITDGIVRAAHRSPGTTPTPLEPGTAYQYDIDLWSTANVFQAGHRIRVQVTSSNFPRWDANPNTGTPFTSTKATIAHQHIHHTPDLASTITLPVHPS